MTNQQIILNATREQLTAQQRHEIAAAVHTPEQIAALAASIIITGEDGAEAPGTIEDAELLIAAGEVHTLKEWNRRGKSIKTGEKHLIDCKLWMFTTKPSRAQREAAAAAGKEAEEHPHFYPTNAYLFSCLQVQDTPNRKAAGRFNSLEEIKAYNAKLAAERKAAKAAAAAAPNEKPTEKATTKPATKKPAAKPATKKATKKAAAKPAAAPAPTPAAQPDFAALAAAILF